MVITEEEAIHILVMMSYYLRNERIVVENAPAAEGLGEVKLARRIGEEFPDLKSHVEMVLKGDY